MAYTIINKSSDYFNTKLYTGNNSNNHSITGIGFAPDMVWQKRRDGGNSHVLFNKVSGATKYVHPDGNSAEITSNAGQDTISLDSDGFTLGVSTQAGGINQGSCVSWNWKANGAGSANTAGSINSTVSANTTSGFSIVSWTGTGSAATIGHGLGKVPKMIIAKQRNTARNWVVYFLDTTIANNNVNNYLELDTTIASTGDSGGRWGSYTNYSTTTFGVGTDNGTNQSGGTYIAYVFSDIQAYSKFGKYIGNGNNDGTFVYTGFKPAFVMVKNTAITEQWSMHDNKRNDNVIPNYARLTADNSQAEDTNTTFAKVELFSNGFKLGNSADVINDSGAKFIYMAFAEAPLVGSNNVPCTAR